ncbi:hypothetical protein [Yinghuangia sp. YIM S10712]|uniref:hypothetical protein n=1 Tax=Yinghuangia sp. YIM S10712 TaxID=3436930 RepID=UPI003F538B48
MHAVDDSHGHDDNAPLARPYTAVLTPTPDARAYLDQLARRTRPFKPPLVVLLAWGTDTTHAAFAMQRGTVYARTLRYRVRETFTSYCEHMRDAMLFDIATRRFVRREIDYSRAWWLVPHSAVSLRDLDMARTAQQQADIEQAAAEGLFMRDADHGPNALSPAYDSLPRPYLRQPDAG